MSNNFAILVPIKSSSTQYEWCVPIKSSSTQYEWWLMHMCESVLDAAFPFRQWLSNILISFVLQIRHWHTSRKSHYLRSKKKNCEPLKSWDMKIIPMTMENPNIALFFLISDWKIQCNKKKCPKRLFLTIFTPKTDLSPNGESWKLVCIGDGVPSVCVLKIMRISQF